MAKRYWLFALLSSALAVGLPSASLAQSSDKEQVLALSRTIDAFIAAKQKEVGVSPAPRADDLTYFRRLNLDLVGRIPELNDPWDFLQNDDPNKRWDWVDRFLAADTYSRHFAAILRTHI